MKIRQREIGDVVVLDIQGKILGGADAGVFQQGIDALLDAGHRKVVVNLEGVGWINSTGLGILIAGFSALERHGGRLKLLHASPRIQSLLAVTKLSTVFELFQQEDAAVQSFV